MLKRIFALWVMGWICLPLCAQTLKTDVLTLATGGISLEFEKPVSRIASGYMRVGTTGLFFNRDTRGLQVAAGASFAVGDRWTLRGEVGYIRNQLDSRAFPTMLHAVQYAKGGSFSLGYKLPLANSKWVLEPHLGIGQYIGKRMAVIRNQHFGREEIQTIERDLPENGRIHFPGNLSLRGKATITFGLKIGMRLQAEN